MEHQLTAHGYQLAEAIALTLQACDEQPTTAFVANLFPPTREGYDVFRFLDERPGDHRLAHVQGDDHSSAYGRWHRYLRVARNDGQTRGLMDRFASMYDSHAAVQMFNGDIFYVGWQNHPESHVTLRIWRTSDDAIVVVFTERADNQGASITNTAEHAVRNVLNLFGDRFGTRQIEWYEHYPHGTFDRIIPHGPGRPEWKHVPPEQRQQIADRCGITLSELVPRDRAH